MVNILKRLRDPTERVSFVVAQRVVRPFSYCNAPPYYCLTTSSSQPPYFSDMHSRLTMHLFLIGSEVDLDDRQSSESIILVGYARCLLLFGLSSFHCYFV